MDFSTDHAATYKPFPPPPPKRRRGFLRFIFWALILAGAIVSVSAIIAAATIPSIANINDCFTTSMFKVELCPSKPGYVRYNALPKHLINSLIGAEDATFFFHKGFDWEEIQDSLEKSLDAGRWVRGGSTITQQLAKNLYLSKEKSLVRKLKEFFIAQQIEKKLTKPQIIEKYLNVVEFGPGVYGIQKGAQHYFQKSVGALSPAESAYLISLLPNPIKYSGAYHSRKELSSFNKRRVTSILYILHVQGKITTDEYNYEVARAEYGLWSGEPPSNMYSPEPTLEDVQNALEASDEDAEALEGTSSGDSTEAPAIEPSEAEESPETE